MAQPQASQELTSKATRSDTTIYDKSVPRAKSAPQAVSTPPQCTEPMSLLEQLQQGHLMIVDSQRRNGLILYKKYHAEFAGPGAAVGGMY